MSMYQLVESAAPSPAKYENNRRLAVVETTTADAPKMISLRARGVIRIVCERTVAASVAMTPAGRARSEYWQIRAQYEAMVAALNAGGVA